ncbi:hypothetical protein ILYODFUR_035253 [Ilyodon furcidens]|uniref:NADH dehydrogenase subunit 6 n=1 Tax=Ilyodon furcidens TaxID=33524 RepID=A0ABV0VC52_9TELE
MRVEMCDYDCVCLFLCQVGSWACSLSWLWVLFSPHSLPVAGVSACWYTCGSRVQSWVLWYVCSLLVAACWGLDPWTLSGLCLGSYVSRVSGLWVHGWICYGVDGGACGLVAAAPWGFCTVAAGWFFLFISVSVSVTIEIIPKQFLIKFLL